MSEDKLEKEFKILERIRSTSKEVGEDEFEYVFMRIENEGDILKNFEEQGLITIINEGFEYA